MAFGHPDLQTLHHMMSFFGNFSKKESLQIIYEAWVNRDTLLNRLLPAVTQKYFAVSQNINRWTLIFRKLWAFLVSALKLLCKLLQIKKLTTHLYRYIDDTCKLAYTVIFWVVLNGISCISHSSHSVHKYSDTHILFDIVVMRHGHKTVYTIVIWYSIVQFCSLVYISIIQCRYCHQSAILALAL
jgi:hypothetical protein